MIRSKLELMDLPNSSRLPPPATAMTVSRSLTAQIRPVVLLSVSQNWAAKSSTPPIREYFLKITSPSRLV